MDVTRENRSLFDEHLAGVSALASEEGVLALEGLSSSTPRTEFLKRFAALLDGKRQA